MYCDPPYEGCTAYPGLPAFDHAELWATMREWSKRNVVLISEYRAPADFVCIASAPKPSSLAGGDRQTVRTERLFCHISVLPRLKPPLAPPPVAAPPLAAPPVASPPLAAPHVASPPLASPPVALPPERVRKMLRRLLK